MTRVPANRYLAFFLLAVAGVTGDLYSKHVVFADLGYPFKSGKPFFEGWISFRFYTSFNEGALWGVGQGYAWLFAALSCLAIAGILYWLFVYGAAASLWLTVSLAFIMSGTLGNLYDRLGLHGCFNPETDGPRYAVRDFLLFIFGEYRWPVFNFADVFLVTGAVMLVVQSFQAEMQSESQPATEQAATAVPAKSSSTKTSVGS